MRHIVCALAVGVLLLSGPAAGMADDDVYMVPGWTAFLTDGRICYVYQIYYYSDTGETPVAWQMTLHSDCNWEVFQDHAYGGDLPPDPAFFGIDPDLQYDTFVSGPCWENPDCENSVVVYSSSETPTTYDVAWGDEGIGWAGGDCLIAQFSVVCDDPTLTPWFTGQVMWAMPNDPGLRTYPFGNVYDDCNGNCRDDAVEMDECDDEAWCSDCNNNGVLDVCDIESGNSQDTNGNGIPDECEDYWADIDGDGDVDLQDLAILLAHYGMSSSDISHSDGDLDGDHDVDLQDLAILLAEYGSGT